MHPVHLVEVVYSSSLVTGALKSQGGDIHAAGMEKLNDVKKLLLGLVELKR